MLRASVSKFCTHLPERDLLSNNRSEAFVRADVYRAHSQRDEVKELDVVNLLQLRYGACCQNAKQN